MLAGESYAQRHPVTIHAAPHLYRAHMHRNDACAGIDTPCTGRARLARFLLIPM
jgi:hypothetical protein